MPINTFQNKIRQILSLVILLLNYSALVYPQIDSLATENTSAIDSLATENTSAIDSLATDSTSVIDSLIVEAHPQDVSKQAGFIITNLGKWAEIKLYGSVRLAGAYDLNGITNANGFSTYDIPVGEESTNQARFFMAPNQSRLGLEVTRSGLLKNFRIKIETDFLGAENGLRIRHAFVETGNFIIGQTWSTFTDVNSVPQTVDIDGPNSSVQLRTVRIRYSNLIWKNRLNYIVSLESPDPDVRTSDSLSASIPSQFLPDIAGQLIHNYSNGYLSICGIIRGITVKNSPTSTGQIFGYGVLLAGVYNLDTENKFLFQGVFGQAISRFITALSGKGLDLVYNPGAQSFEATRAFGLLGSYAHKWRSDMSSAFTVGMVGIINKDYEPPDAFSQSWYYSGNIFWNAFLGVRLGLEFSQGRRINKDGNFGRATRIGFIFYADF